MTSKIKISLMSKSLFTRNEHFRLIKGVQGWRLCPSALFKAFFFKSTIKMCLQVAPSPPSHLISILFYVSWYSTRVSSHTHLSYTYDTSGAFSFPRSPPLPHYPFIQNFAWCQFSGNNCWVVDYLWDPEFGHMSQDCEQGDSGLVFLESGIATPQQLRTIIAVTGGCVWVYGKKENPYAVLWLSNASVKDGGEEDEGWADTQRALEFWNLFWVKQVRRIRLVSWIENK